jgi:flagellar biosynthesis protein FlhB
LVLLLWPLFFQLTCTILQRILPLHHQHQHQHHQHHRLVVVVVLWLLQYVLPTAFVVVVPTASDLSKAILDSHVVADDRWVGRDGALLYVQTSSSSDAATLWC